MNEVIKDSEVDTYQWQSTYGVITAERILARYQISVNQDYLLKAITSSGSFYHRLLSVPMKNVLNGIILQQAQDYHLYIQKLFIDYLLSGEQSKGEDAQGSSTRELLETERNDFNNVSELFQVKQGEHSSFIASSQRELILFTEAFKQMLEKVVGQVYTLLHKENVTCSKIDIKDALDQVLVASDLNQFSALKPNYETLFFEQVNSILKANLNFDLQEQVQLILFQVLNAIPQFTEMVHTLHVQVEEINIQLNSFRSQFHDTVIRILDLIKLLPEYKFDSIKDAANKAHLFFDNSIGDKS